MALQCMPLLRQINYNMYDIHVTMANNCFSKLSTADPSLESAFNSYSITDILQLSKIYTPLQKKTEKNQQKSNNSIVWFISSEL